MYLVCRGVPAMYRICINQNLLSRSRLVSGIPVRVWLPRSSAYVAFIAAQHRQADKSSDFGDSITNVAYVRDAYTLGLQISVLDEYVQGMRMT
jgi:hypothetical protein